MTETTVCIIDDDVQVLSSVAALLQAVGFHVKKYELAETFLEDCTASAVRDFGCLVLDVRLPGMSGLELQEELRRRDIHIPVILISGHANEEVAQLGLANGAHSLLEKPFHGHRLVEAVTNILSPPGDRVCLP